MRARAGVTVCISVSSSAKAQDRSGLMSWGVAALNRL